MGYYHYLKLGKKKIYKVVEKKTVKLRMAATCEGVKKFADLDIWVSTVSFI
jgi:hypothetical protein